MKKNKLFEGRYLSNKFMNARIGGSVELGGNLAFEVSGVRISAGYVTLLDENNFQRTCYNTLYADQTCKIEARYSDVRLCLKCIHSSPPPKIVANQYGQSCDPAPSSNPKRDSYYTSRLYDTCVLGQYMKSRNCHPCFAGCIRCYGDPENKCRVCDYRENTYLDGGSCTNCGPGNYLMDGDCLPCSKAGCQNCPQDRCQTVVCQGTQTYINGECCERWKWSSDRGGCMQNLPHELCDLL